MMCILHLYSPEKTNCASAAVKKREKKGEKDDESIKLHTSFLVVY